MEGRILVTGGAGFVGSSVVQALLARGDQVTVLDSGVSAGFEYLAGSGASVAQGDVRERADVEQAMDGCDAVVHLAAQASVTASLADPLSDAAVNLDASLVLLDLARLNGVRRFVFASSNAVVSGHAPPAHEQMVPSPVTPYGAAKAAVEAYLSAYSRAYGLDAVALRFANAYGPRSAHQTSVIASFIKAYLAGGPLVVHGSGHQTRDFIHVLDIATAVLAALDAPAGRVAGAVIQIGTGRETSLLELAEILFGVAGGRVAIEHRPATPGDVERNYSDIVRARNDLAWVPQIELRDGLVETLDWYRERAAR
jgi:UDP-glucose 4-epimerase